LLHPFLHGLAPADRLAPGIAKSVLTQDPRVMAVRNFLDEL